jgi:hypothetical protein
MRRSIAALIVLPLLALLPATSGSASAATSKAPYTWHVADQFLHDAVGSPLGAIARADNGDTITVEGFGKLDSADKTASGGGTFVHKDADGNVLFTGTWVATGLVSFQFYGCGGGGLPDFLCGGLAKLNVIATPDAHPSVHLPATLWINCLLGDPPPSEFEGVRLNVKDLINFNKALSEHEGSGFTVFVAPVP